jgi:hypothetical protein
MTIRIKVVGCQRYSFKGELFDKGFVYDLEDGKARELLNKQDDYGRAYFARVEKPVAEPDDVIIEETTSEEVDGVRIKRSRGRPRKNPVIKTGGDTTPLEAEDVPAGAADDEDGGEEIPV